VRSVLHLLWDLSAPGARCSVDDLERKVHEAGLARFTGMQDLHHKVWFRDRSRYGSVMVFSSPEARDACMATVTQRVTAMCGLPPARVEAYDVIAVAEGSAGPVPVDHVGSEAHESRQAH
jgi:hypothetical protein